ncbi:hypothetical protein CPB86DRAFT_824913 [Serendipita vermifera]|nr:hypothetical protein CPB86DRAFT_824913 [Serendipita vermifera]
MLQLVCRLWASTLQSLQHICTITDFENLSYPGTSIEALDGVERIDVVPNAAYCPCAIDLLKRPCLLELKRHIPQGQGRAGWWEDMENERLKDLLHRVRVFSFDNRSAHIEKLIALMPNLRTLFINFPDPTDVDTTPLSHTLLTHQSHLTYLQLYSLTWTAFCRYASPPKPWAQSLRYLELHFNRTPEGNSLGQRTIWDFPRLETLTVQGDLQSQVREDVYSFIQQCGRTVREFADLLYFWEDDMDLSYTGIIHHDQFPRLHTYGLRRGALEDQFTTVSKLDSTLSHSTALPRTLLIYGFTLGLGNNNPNMLGQLSSYMKSLGFNNIIIWSTWSRLKYIYDRVPDDMTYVYRDFFNGFMRTGMTFSDKDGIELRDPRCNWFWEERREKPLVSFT